MLIEARIFLPTEKLYSQWDGDKLPELHWVERRAAELFGGFTWDASMRGGWVSPDGGLVTESMERFLLAIDSLGSLALLVAFARECGAKLGEHSVYISALGMSEIVLSNPSTGAQS